MSVPAADAVIDAIVEEVGKRIPSTASLCAITDPTDMGPEVTIPAIWMSLLLERIKGLQLEAHIRRGEAARCLPRWKTPTTTDEMGEYAGALGDHAVATHGDRLDAATSLLQAGVAVLMTTLPAVAVVQALDGLPDLFNLRETLGIDKARQ